MSPETQPVVLPTFPPASPVGGEPIHVEPVEGTTPDLAGQTETPQERLARLEGEIARMQFRHQITNPARVRDADRLYAAFLAGRLSYEGLRALSPSAQVAYRRLHPGLVLPVAPDVLRTAAKRRQRTATRRAMASASRRRNRSR